MKNNQEQIANFINYVINIQNESKFQIFVDKLKFYLIDKPTDLYYNIKWYIKNRILFNNILKEWRPWDSYYQVMLFKFGIEQLCECIKNGHEEDLSRNKKVEAMKKLITELSRDVEDEVFKNVYGENYDFGLYVDSSNNAHFSNTDKNKKLCKKYEELLYKEENKHFNTIFSLIKGQDRKKLEKEQAEQIENLQGIDKENNKKDGYYSVWVNLFDGSGIKNWWD